MYKQTNTPQGDTLRTQNNVNETPNISSSTHEEIPGTPFMLRSYAQEEGVKWFITCGKHRLTEPTNNKETTLLKLENEKWNIIIHLILVVLDEMPTYKEWEKKQIPIRKQ